MPQTTLRSRGRRGASCKWLCPDDATRPRTTSRQRWPRWINSASSNGTLPHRSSASRSQRFTAIKRTSDLNTVARKTQRKFGRKPAQQRSSPRNSGKRRKQPFPFLLRFHLPFPFLLQFQRRKSLTSLPSLLRVPRQSADPPLDRIRFGMPSRRSAAHQ